MKPRRDGKQQFIIRNPFYVLFVVFLKQEDVAAEAGELYDVGGIV